MQPQTGIEAQGSRVAPIEAPGDGVEERLARLEATVTQLQEELRKLLTPSERLASRPFGMAQGKDGGYSWVEPPAHLKGVTDFSRLEPEELVYIHELTDDDVRRRLKKLEQWYGMSSDEFYRRWKRGEADDIFEKIEWSALYEDWLRIEAES